AVPGRDGHLGQPLRPAPARPVDHGLAARLANGGGGRQDWGGRGTVGTDARGARGADEPGGAHYASRTLVALRAGRRRAGRAAYECGDRRCAGSDVLARSRPVTRALEIDVDETSAQA